MYAVILLYLTIYVNLCADIGIALENGEQEAHGVQKSGKIDSIVQFADSQVAKAYPHQTVFVWCFFLLSNLFYFLSLQFNPACVGVGTHFVLNTFIP